MLKLIIFFPTGSYDHVIVYEIKQTIKKYVYKLSKLDFSKI